MGDDQQVPDKYIFDVSDEGTTIELEAGGNKKRPEQWRMRATVRPLSSADYATAVRRATGNAADDGSDSAVAEELFVVRVTKLENFYFRLSDGVHEVTDARELYRLRHPVAVDAVGEITQAFSAREAVDTKN